jgi:malate dehydrogenase (oxaloacetate-decarboxylating)
MKATPSASYSVTLRVEHPRDPGVLGQILTTIGEVEGMVGAVDIVRVQENRGVRDITVNARDPEHAQQISDAVDELEGIRVVSFSDRTFLVHQGGKIEVKPKMSVQTRDSLSMAYTPGVARISQAIANDPRQAFNLTVKRNTIAVVSDGTAVLGLGDVGPEAAMPVMEGKAMLFKELADVDAYPICLSCTDTEDIITTIKNIAPGFGGINLEDIASPRCFEIEDRLQEELDIPVFHDDQHGTAVVVLAALTNSLKLVGKKLENLKVIVNGVGASGSACVKILLSAGVKNIIGLDSRGLVHPGREGLSPMERWVAENTNPEGLTGGLSEVIVGADLFLGLSVPDVLTVEHLDSMAEDPIVFAMANPDPEIAPEETEGRVRIMATGRSDYPNQINNTLCFPGIFRGALDSRAREMNEEMMLAAAYALADVIPEEDLSEDYVIPSVFDDRIVPTMAEAVEEAARTSGAARTSLQEEDVAEAPRKLRTLRTTPHPRAQP